MSGLFRAIVVLVAATGAISFPTNPPNETHRAQSEGSKRRAVGAPALPGNPAKAAFDASNLEFYMTDDGIAYIRPGLKLKVNSITIPADRKPVVEVSFTDGSNQPLDRLGQVTPGAISASFILAWWDPAARHYTTYATRSVKTPANSPRPGVEAKQPTTDSAGTWTDLSIGQAKYKFGVALPEGFDQTKTHTLGFQAVRNLTTEIGKNYRANLEYDFRPDGAKVTETWAKINDATSCLNCHDPETFGFHGSAARKDVKLCVLCHQPQNSDPDTGNSLDMKVMVHKIHAPHELSAPYIIYGNNMSKHDYSEVTYPQDVRNCDNCHEGTVPASKPLQAENYLTKPSRDACGSCHDDINWTTGANHPAGAQTSDANCATCHVPDSGAEFDASVKAAHVIPTKSDQLMRYKAEIVSVTNVAPGQSPTVVFKITDKKGNKVDGTKLSTFSPICAGPTTSYSSYYREDARAKGVYDEAAGTTTYTFTAKIPADAPKNATWAFSADMYKTVELKRADGKANITGVRDIAYNPIKYVGMNGAPAAPRRTIVTTAQCNACHDTLALHGGQRVEVNECVICHNPTMDDKARRPADAGPPESISFNRLIHRIHSGHELKQDFTVYGFGGTAFHFNEVTYPGDRRNCAKCHTANSHRLPPSSGDAVVTLRDYFSPQGPGTASCLGCHDSKDAAAHAFLNTTNFGGKPAEACGACHGANSEWSADKVHAR